MKNAKTKTKKQTNASPRATKRSTEKKQWSGIVGASTWTVFNDDAKRRLTLLDNESVDCIVTSPPYFWLRDYQVDGQIGLEESVDGYVVALTDILSEAHRVLKTTGTLFLNLGDTYYSGKGKSHGTDRKSSKRRFGLRAVDKSGGLGIGLQRKSIIGIPWRVAIKMCCQNWILRSPIIWQRIKCLRESVRDRPSRGYEYIFMFVKSRKYYWNKNGLPKNSASPDVWSIPAKVKGNGSLETAPFPDELARQCIEVGCPPNGVVLDPFCGSGTSLRVATEMGRDAIGIDLNRRFCEYAAKSLSLKGS